MGIGTVVIAVKDTWDNKEILVGDLEEVRKYKNYDAEKEKVNNPSVSVLTEESRKDMLLNARKKLFADGLKTYWKSAIGSGGSIILILSGKKMLHRQIVEISAMYASLLESFRRYRKNLIDDMGAEKDQEYAYGIKTMEVVDPETGETSTKIVKMNGGRICSPYARRLNEGVWDSEAGRWIWVNRLYTSNKLELEARLRGIQASCNDLLIMKGYMTLNEVYYKLGLPPSEEGQHVGWVRGGFTDGSAGDDFIDFGVFPEYCGGKYQLPINKEFLDPKSNQKAPLLDFNVICLDKIWDDIYEYDNRSPIVYDQRRVEGYAGSKEGLDRWFRHAEYMDR